MCVCTEYYYRHAYINFRRVRWDSASCKPLLRLSSFPIAESHVFVSLNQDFCNPSVKSLNFSCIENADQLQALFQNSLVAGRMYRTSLLLIHIRMAASQNSSNVSRHLEDKCTFCEASDTQDICSTTAVYSHAVFELFPYPLVTVFLLPANTIRAYLTHTITRGFSIEEVCWTPPLPFCHTSNVGNIIFGSIRQVRYYAANIIIIITIIVVPVSIVIGCIY